MRGSALAVALALLSLVWVSCTEKNPRYCEADKDCGSGTCVVAERRCVEAPADMTMAQVDMSSGGSGDMATPDLATPDLMPPRECSVDKDCAAKTATPACNAAGRCVPCTRNYQCPESACIYAPAANAGSCVPAAQVAIVEEANDAMNPTNCSPIAAGGKPYCLIDQFLADPAPAALAKTVVFFRKPKVQHTNNTGFVDIFRSLRLVGQRADRTATQVVLADPLRITPPSDADITVSIEDMSLSNQNAGGASALACTRMAKSERQINLAIRWSRFENNPAAALQSQACNSVIIANSVFTRNAIAGLSSIGAIDISGGDVSITNAIISANGNSSANNTRGGAVFMENRSGTLDLGTVNLAFNTIADNICRTSGSGNPNSNCNFYSEKAATMTYSIVTGTKNRISSNITLLNSIVPSDYGTANGNIASSGSFPAFVNAGAFDYHLSPNAVNTAARVDNQNPSEKNDVDDDPRPVNGRVDIGADQRP